MQCVSISDSMEDFEVPFSGPEGVAEHLPFCSALIHVGCGGDTFLPPRLSLLLCNISRWTAYVCLNISILGS